MQIKKVRMKNVIVTGANGFIGSSLIRALVDKNVRVKAVDVSFQTSRLPEMELITKIETCVDSSLVEKLPEEEYDAFYHLAWKGVNGVEKANPSVQLANIQMAIDCAGLCKMLKVKKFLCAGTVAENAIYSLPNILQTNGGMMYGVSKHCTQLILETYCKNINVPFVWMQFSNIYGVGNTTGNLVSYTLGEILKDKVATFGPANQLYDFIYVDDLIEAVFRLGDSETNKSFYYIGSGRPRLLKEYLLRIGELANCECNIKIGERPDDGIKYKMEMFDNKDLVNAIGEYVKVQFDEGIINTINWLKENNCN